MDEWANFIFPYQYDIFSHFIWILPLCLRLLNVSVRHFPWNFLMLPLFKDRLPIIDVFTIDMVQCTAFIMLPGLDLFSSHVWSNKRRFLGEIKSWITMINIWKEKLLHHLKIKKLQTRCTFCFCNRTYSHYKLFTKKNTNF